VRDTRWNGRGRRSLVVGREKFIALQGTGPIRERTTAAGLERAEGHGPGKSKESGAGGVECCQVSSTQQPGLPLSGRSGMIDIARLEGW